MYEIQFFFLVLCMYVRGTINFSWTCSDKINRGGGESGYEAMFVVLPRLFTHAHYCCLWYMRAPQPPHPRSTSSSSACLHCDRCRASYSRKKFVEELFLGENSFKYSACEHVAKRNRVGKRCLRLLQRLQLV